MDWVLLIGRILFAANFLFAGVGFHLKERKMATEYSRSQGVPLAELGVPLTGVLIAVAGAMVILGFWVDLAALVLGRERPGVRLLDACVLEARRSDDADEPDDALLQERPARGRRPDPVLSLLRVRRRDRPDVGDPSLFN